MNNHPVKEESKVTLQVTGQGPFLFTVNGSDYFFTDKREGLSQATKLEEAQKISHSAANILRADIDRAANVPECASI